MFLSATSAQLIASYHETIDFKAEHGKNDWATLQWTMPLNHLGIS